MFTHSGSPTFVQLLVHGALQALAGLAHTCCLAMGHSCPTSVARRTLACPLGPFFPMRPRAQSVPSITFVPWAQGSRAELGVAHDRELHTPSCDEGAGWEGESRFGRLQIQSAESGCAYSSRTTPRPRATARRLLLRQQKPAETQSVCAHLPRRPDSPICRRWSAHVPRPRPQAHG